MQAFGMIDTAFARLFLPVTLLGGLLHSGQTNATAALAVQIGQNFTGSTYGVNTFALPADGDGAIGPGHFVEFINGRFAIYAKADGSLLQSTNDMAFWENAGITIPGGEDVSDPRVVFDPASQRWFASAISFDPRTFAGNSFFLAISGSADPTGLWQTVSLVADPANGNFADFPTLGLDADAVYLAADMFAPGATGGGVGSSLVSIPKPDLLPTPTTRLTAA